MRFACIAIVWLSSGCASVHVEYNRRIVPKLVNLQMLASVSTLRGETHHDSGSALAAEAGCMRAALAAGQPVSAVHMSNQSETPTTLVFRQEVDSRQVARASGADAILVGKSELSVPSLRMTELKLEVRGANDEMWAEAHYSNSDGADPIDAGEEACAALFRGWGPRAAAKPAALAGPVYIEEIDDMFNAAFQRGCAEGAQAGGANLVNRASDAKHLLSVRFSHIYNQQYDVTAALVVRTDEMSVVQSYQIYYGDGGAQNMQDVARKLCRAVVR
jgi:hypothetical protein